MTSVSDKQHTCGYEGCTRAFKTSTELKVHIRAKHTFERPHSCDRCPKTSASGDLCKHQHAVHDHKKPFACDKCDAAFSRSVDLSTHKLRLHSDIRPFVCDFDAGGEDGKCPFKCVTKYDLVVHQRKHSGEKPCACDHPGCDKKFSQLSNLASHKKRAHLKLKPFACDFEECEYKCFSSQELEAHKRGIHTGETPFVCDVPGCPYKSSQASHLTAHKRRHDGIKSHICAACGDAFVEACDLVVHYRKHSGSKPYSCDVCGRTFAQSAHLGYHKLLHTGAKPWACDFEGCGMACTTSGNLKAHKDRMHSPEGQARQKKQEQRIARALDIAGIPYKREHHIDFVCVGDVDGSYARIDFVIIMDGRIIFLEVDEGQHKFGYGSAACDMKRMAKIIESLTLGGNTLPIVFLRYNPNAFTIDGLHAKLKKVQREAALVALLRNTEAFPNAMLTVQYMYYDTIKQVAAVQGDPAYHQMMADCCLPAIVGA